MDMAKRYYWLKLKDDFFTSKEIKKLRRVAGGDTYTIIYQKMLLLAMKSDGILTWTGLEDSFGEELALELDEKTEDVEMTLFYLLKSKLAETQDDKQFYFPYSVENTGSEGASADRTRKYRERQALQSDRQALQSDAPLSLGDISVTERKREEKREDIRYESKNEEGEKRVQGEGNRTTANSAEVSELVQAFEYAFQNNLIHEVVAIRDKLYSMGYDPKGNRIDQSNLS